MNGGYTLYDVDVFADDANDVHLRCDKGTSGIGCVVRDGRDVIDFQMFGAGQISTQGIGRDLLLTRRAREASVCARLRRQYVTNSGSLPNTKISVAICTKDRPDWLQRLLQSLAEQTICDDFEIIVVDNNSQDPAVRRVAEAFDVHYVFEPKTGLNFARNAAVAAASGDVVAFLDDDTTAEREWFANLSRVWAENPDAGCVTGLVLPMSLDAAAQVAFEKDGGFRRAFLPARFARHRWKYPLHPCGPGDFGAGANMSVDRRLVLDLGGFDEALDTGQPLPGGGDLDIFYRIIRVGRPLVYDPGVVVRHEHRREIDTLRRQYYTWGQGFFAYLQKSKQSDPENLKTLKQMDRWFWLQMGRRLLSSVRQRDTRSTTMLWAELMGAIKGRFGEYERSCERSRQIRELAK